MAAVVPLSDVSRRPTTLPAVTLGLIVVNVIVFLIELALGDSFVLRWSMVPAQITAGHHIETIVTAMFMHAS
jgi:membrane associated rhomboid family serine protease